MSARVAMPPQYSAGGVNTLSPQLPNPVRGDEPGSGAEGPARKRLQKTAVNDVATSKRPTISTSMARTTVPRSMTDPRLNPSNRRKSLRDSKVPLGPRAPDFAPSKPSSHPVYATNRPEEPSSSSHGLGLVEPGTASATFALRYPLVASRSGVDLRPGAQEFLPAVNFDELHRSLTSYDSGPDQHMQSETDPAVRTQERPLRTNPFRGDVERTVVNFSGPRLGRTGSLRQRSTNTLRAAQLSMSSSAAIKAAEGAFEKPPQQDGRVRPNAARIVAARANRKSLGPGIVPSAASSAGGQPATFAVPRALDHAPGEKEKETTRAIHVRRGTQTLRPLESEDPRLIATSRNPRVKSFQPAPSMSEDSSGHRSATTETSPSSSTAASVNTAKSTAWSATPAASSASRRMSVVPAHATGLGARTISPTDARRMKRMSMLPDPTLALPTRTPDTPEFRSTPQSPSLMPPKSLTPSSSRTTPEPGRKTSTPGLSASSSSNSYASARTSTGLPQPRLSQSWSTSRLPTPKPRNLHSSASGQEVPPIPAIPKAFESPKEPFKGPFFGERKSSFAVSVDKDGGGDRMSESSDWKGHSDADHERRRKPGHDPGYLSGAEKNADSGPGPHRKRLQPLQLPPLNLLPLSTPTVAKVAALQDSTRYAPEGRLTPNPRRATRTPTTPMTASKAAFHLKANPQDPPAPMSVYMRSNSSNILRTSESASFRAQSSSESSAPAHDEIPPERRTLTPYISSSLPKSTGMVNASKGAADVDGKPPTIDARRPKVNGPRSKTFGTATHHDAPDKARSSVEPVSPSSGSSLRRKWSLSFRRSSSKASILPSDHDAGCPPPPPKHDDMPPPKLPASAAAPSPSPPIALVSRLEAHSRRSPVVNPLMTNERPKSSVWSSHALNRGKKDAPLRSETSAVIAPSLKAPGAKTVSNNVRNGPREAGLDPDDLLAEDEMKRLAAGKKDIGAAAAELDRLSKMATPKERVAAAQALRIVNLNLFERGEIVDYKDVYFCGTQNAKKHVGDLNAQATNFGYDDDRGDYKIVHGDHLAYRYEIIDLLGKGSFGQVVRCVDHKNGGLVAVKIIRNKKRFHQQALVEVNILRKLREWDPQCKHSMVKFSQSFYFRGHLCISTELLGMNLYEFIKLHDFRGFSLKLIRRFTKQLLNSLALLHGHKIIHCDMKPENILLAHPVHSEIKVIDFGSSCFETAKVYTYIQSRFYRSPEVILGMAYGLAIDIWSLGCILAELYTGYPLFPGDNEQEQLACIMEVFGPPEKHLIERSTRKKLFFDSLGKPRLTVSSKGRRRRPSSKTLQQALKCDDDAFVDFIARCLRWDPERRLKPADAMQHDFITGLRTGNRLGGTARARSGLHPGTAATASPLKRVPTVPTGLGTRPLPDPPGTTGAKAGGSHLVRAAREREAPSNSPNKRPPPLTTASLASTTAARRHSTIHALQSAAGVKRSSTGVALGASQAAVNGGTALPRVAVRAISNKGELATAAAAAAAMAVRLRVGRIGLELDGGFANLVRRSSSSSSSNSNNDASFDRLLFARRAIRYVKATP
ncbi:MAG: hypothetical protein M1826_003607 [Phylliscum demangeonii]|nr:MAG: hypothetical protein M1826_003607 [Phylliscum demangeonii]